MKKSSCRPILGPGSVTLLRSQPIDTPPADKIQGLGCLLPPALFGRGSSVTPERFAG
jgi:hypothetical protein